MPQNSIFMLFISRKHKGAFINVKSDREIVELVLQGETEEYALLVERYENALRGYITQIVRNHHVAEEIAQEIFVRAYEKLNCLRNRAAFGAWIFKIARREAIQSARMAKRNEPLEPEHAADQAASPSILDDGRQMLLDALKRLPKHEQKTIYLKHFGGYSAQEIADMNGSPAGTITKQLSRAYARLRKWLKED
jgi:RNA polymerase sigma-70 factor, ECF subfamily